MPVGGQKPRMFLAMILVGMSVLSGLIMIITSLFDWDWSTFLSPFFWALIFGL